MSAGVIAASVASVVSTARFTDLTGHGNTISPGTVDQSPAGPNSLLHSSLFDGSQALSSPYVGSTATGRYSLEFWYKGTDPTFVTASQNSSPVVGCYAGVGKDLFGNGVDGGVHYGMTKGSFYMSAWSSSATVHNNGWHHIVCRWDGTPTAGTTHGILFNQFSVLIDGVAVALGTTNFGSLTTWGAVMVALTSIGSGMVGYMTGYACYPSWITTTQAAAHIAASSVSDAAYVTACLADNPDLLWLF
jgi:hypothetical protein